jgi:hypothetical protein
LVVAAVAVRHALLQQPTKLVAVAVAAVDTVG